MADTSGTSGPGRGSQVNLALGLAAATVLVFVILAATDADGPIWLLVAVLGAIAAIVGWRSGQGSRPSSLALVAVLVGLVGVALVLGWLIADSV
jgi:hypothetical protein